MWKFDTVTAAFVLICWCTCKHTDTTPNCCNQTLAPQLIFSHGVVNPTSTSTLHICSHAYAHSSRVHDISVSVYTPSVVLLSGWGLMLQRKWHEEHLLFNTNKLIMYFLWHREHKLWLFIIQKKLLFLVKPTNRAVSSPTKHQKWQHTTKQPQGSSQ